jgi:hypothetical protein
VVGNLAFTQILYFAPFAPWREISFSRKARQERQEKFDILLFYFSQ